MGTRARQLVALVSIMPFHVAIKVIFHGTMAARVTAAAKLHAITLLKSPIGRQQSVRDTLLALGLRKRHQTVVHKNTLEVRVPWFAFPSSTLLLTGGCALRVPVAVPD